MVNTRHEQQLWMRLDELFAKGTTTVSWGEIYHWYGVEKIRKAPWRDIQARWKELLEEKGLSYVDPLVAQTGGGFSMFYASPPQSLRDLAE